MNISREHLAKAATAKRGISLDLLFQISEIFEISEQDLMDFAEYTENKSRHF